LGRQRWWCYSTPSSKLEWRLLWAVKYIDKHRDRVYVQWRVHAVVREARCLQAMHGVIDRQPFSLHPWTTCNSFISWLRFFSFTGLVLGCISGTLLSSQYTRDKSNRLVYQKA
jgi:hypothetical protein